MEISTMAKEPKQTFWVLKETINITTMLQQELDQLPPLA
jgi:hypothetical protein